MLVADEPAPKKARTAPRLDAAPPPAMAPRDDPAEIERLRNALARADARADGLERERDLERARTESVHVDLLRAEDQLDKKQRELRAVEEDSHRRSMETYGAATQIYAAATAARVSPVPGMTDADATLPQVAARLAEPQDHVAFRTDLDDAGLLRVGIQYAMEAKDAEAEGEAAAQREQSARARVKLSRRERNYASCQRTFAKVRLDAVRMLLYYRTKSETYVSVSAFVRYLNANLPPEAHFSEALLRSVREGWALVHAYGATKLNGVEIGRDLFDRKKWSKIKAVDDHGTQLGGAESPLAEQKTLEFVLADGFGKDFLAKLKATGKSVKELLKEATGKGTPSVKDISAWDKKIADLKKALAEKRGILAELLSRVAALEAAGSA